MRFVRFVLLFAISALAGCSAANNPDTNDCDEPEFAAPSGPRTREGFISSGSDLRALPRDTTFITSGDHGSPQLVDSDLASLDRFPDLRQLHLRHCRNISDDGLAHIAKVAGLRELDLSGCVKLTGKGIARLESLKSLRELLLNHCPKIKRADVESLQRRLPRCDIVWSSDDPPMGGPPDHQAK